MSEQSAPSQARPAPERVRRGFEYVLFNSRWLMAPFYVGLVVALAVLFLKFLRMLWEFILHAPGAKSSETILDALALIDVTLVGNLHPDRGVLGLREFRLAHRHDGQSELADLDHQDRFRRAEAEAARLASSRSRRSTCWKRS